MSKMIWLRLDKCTKKEIKRTKKLEKKSIINMLKIFLCQKIISLEKIEEINNSGNIKVKNANLAYRLLSNFMIIVQF